MSYKEAVYAVEKSKYEKYDVLYCLAVVTDHERKIVCDRMFKKADYSELLQLI